MSKCTNCKVELNEQNAYRKTSTKLNSRCKKCFNQYCMERWTARRDKAILEKGNACLDCTQTFPSVAYDFHHLDPNSKDMDWSKMRLVKEETLQLELAKCVLLCAVCHRIRHAAERPAKDKLKEPTKKHWQHGTKNGYSHHKCRCELCKAANKESHRLYREKK